MKIILADDHDLLRAGVKDILRAFTEVREIQEAKSYDELLGLSSALQPDIIILDLGLLGAEEELAQYIGRIREAFNTARVIIYSGKEDKETVILALRSGAAGFIPKTSSAKTFAAAVNLVMSGEIYIPVVALENHDSKAPPAIESAKPDKIHLSVFESAVLEKLLEAKSNKIIAAELGAQETTVKMCLRRIFQKLGATNRVDAVRIALAKSYAQKDQS